MWKGEYTFALKNLVLKDFRIRYRNMSLGVFWSLLNPLVMMIVLTFVFTVMFRNPNPDFPVFVLCGLVPFNFFAIAWATGTSAVVENAGLIKRVQMPREMVPIASVFSNCVHLLIQMGLLIAMVLLWGKGVNRYWLFIPVMMALEVVFVSGIVLVFSAINVYIRDCRYLVESINTVLVWLVPVYYSHPLIPQKYTLIYELNPLAAIIFGLRAILLDGVAPGIPLLLKLAFASAVSLGVGFFVFGRMRRGFFGQL
ncbi:MAG: ABC transporter permease [Bryobacteraceae bacterium]